LAKTERDFSIKTRRSSRVAIRFPVQITVRNASGAVEEIKAWTAVVNEHGARCECARSLEVDQEVEIANPANRKKAKGRIVWCGTNPDGAGKFEFAVELSEPSGIWHINFPPPDWKFTEVPAADIPAASAAPDAPAVAPAPVVVSVPVEERVPQTAPIASAVAERVHQPETSTEFAPPQAVRDSVLPNPGKQNGGVENGAGLTASPYREHEAERRAMAAFAAEVSTLLEAEPTPPAHPVAVPAGGPSLANPSSDVPGLKERLTQLLMEQIEPMLQPKMEEVLERVVRSMEQRLAATLHEISESRAAEMVERSQELTNLALSCIAEAADDRSKLLRQESKEAVSAAMQDLSSRIAQLIAALEEDLLRQCKSGGNSRRSV